MARKVTTRKTPEQRRAEAEALQASIAEQVEALHDSEQWSRFLTFASAFHRYSLNNLLLILSQRPDATDVAGFRKWQSLGRQVRKGEKAIKIYGYAQKKIRDEDQADDGQNQTTDPETGERVITYFPVLSVFDISQTDPIDPNAPDPSPIAQRLGTDDPAGILEAVRDYLTSQGWTVTIEPIPGATDGYTQSTTRRVVIDADLSPADAAATALHEAAHVLLHADEEPAEYVEHRGIKETEAESVAYIVAGVLGLDTSATSISYVTGWSKGDADLIKATAARVLAAAHKIADAITTQEEATAA